MLRRGIQPGISQPGRLEDDTGKPLNPIVAWSIVLLATVALWWGLWAVISSLL
jgi:hypothetical protein